jgi:hypothetical protein
MASTFGTPDDCLKPGDVRAMKRLAGLTTLEDAVVPGASAAPQDVDFVAGGAGAAVPGAPGSPLAFFVPLLNDATVVSTPGVGLQINPAPQAFTKTVDQAGVLSPGAVPFNNPTFDHVKYLVYGAPVDAPDDGREIGALTVAAAKQTYANPKFPAAFVPHIQNLPRDFRLCSFAANCIDPDNFNVFDMFFTDDTIYAFYEKLPFKKPGYGGSGPDYNAYSSAIPIARRNAQDPP